MKNYVQNNSKSKTSFFRNKSKSNQKLKLPSRNTSKISTIWQQETVKHSSQALSHLVNSDFLINKKYYKAAIVEYQKFNANSIQSYLKGQHHNDYLDIAEIVKFYTPKQYLCRYQKVSAQQKLKSCLKNNQQQKRIKSKCLHFYGVCFYLLRHRENQNKTVQKSLKKVKNSKKSSQNLNVLTQLKKKSTVNLYHSSQRTKHILSTDTLQLQKLTKYLKTIFKKQINMIDQFNQQVISHEQTKTNSKYQNIKGSTSINEFKQIMEEQFSQIHLKSPYKQYQDNSEIYGLSELKRQKHKNKDKIDNDAKLDKNTTDTRASKRFSTNLHLQLSKIIATPKKDGKSKSQSKGQSRHKSNSKSSKTISIKRQVCGKSKSKQKKMNFNSGSMKNSQRESKYNKLTDTERLLFHTQNDIDILSRKNSSPATQKKQKLKKIRSQKDIKISIKKKIKA